MYINNNIYKKGRGEEKSRVAVAKAEEITKISKLKLFEA